MKPPWPLRLIKTFMLNHIPPYSQSLRTHLTTGALIQSQPQMLNNSHSLLTQDMIYTMLRKSRRRPVKALNIFHWACINHAFKPNPIISGQLLRILSKKSTVHYFWAFAYNFSKQGCEISSKDYLAVAMNFKRLNMMNHVVAWNHFYNRRTLPVPATVTVSNTVHGLDVVLGLHQKLSHQDVLYVLNKEDGNPRKAFILFNWVIQKQGVQPNTMIYCLMLKILANKVTIKEFWDLARKMFKESCYIYGNVYLVVLKNFKSLEMRNDATAWFRFWRMSKNSIACCTVRRVVDVVSRSLSDAHLVKNLGEIRFSVSEIVVLGILEELRPYPFKALRFFYWVRAYRGYTHNACTYTTILRVLAQKESIKELWSMVNKMKSVGYDLDIVTYIEITRYLQNDGMMKDAVSLYELMMDGLYKPQVQICTSLLWDIMRADIPDVDLVFRVVRKYEASGPALPKVVYDEILKTLMGVGRFDEAEKILGTMRNAGYEPDHLSYKLLVHGFCKAGRLEEARKAFGEIEAKGWVSDKETWVSLICRHYTDGEIDKALEYFIKMLKNKVEADPYLLEFMVNGLYSKRIVDSASNLFTKLTQKTPLKPSYFHLIVPPKKS